MQGFITDADLGQADQEFPGIQRFFASLAKKPRTFLELLADFEHWTTHPSSMTQAMAQGMSRS